MFLGWYEQRQVQSFSVFFSFVCMAQKLEAKQENSNDIPTRLSSEHREVLAGMCFNMTLA